MDNKTFASKASAFINKFDQLEAEAVTIMNAMVDDDDGIIRFIEILDNLSDMKSEALATGNRELAQLCLFAIVGFGHAISRVIGQTLGDNDGANADE